MDHHIYRLPNGIRLVFHPSASAITHACIILNAGARDEEDGKDGLAHFIEHLLFKRTEKRSTSQILNRLEIVGADLNAYTTKEYTCIHASFLNPYLERSLDLFEDILFHSTFPQEEMKKEKEVILDEIMSYRDQPEEAIQDDFESIIFAGHSLGNNILGRPESLAAFTKKDIAAFMQANYRTDEIVIGISGNYPLKKAVDSVNKTFGKVKENSTTRKRSTVNTPAPRHVTERRSIAQAHAVFGAQAYSLHHKHKSGLMLLNNILGGMGMSSRLNLQLRERYGIAYTIESNYTPFSDTGIFSIYFGTDTEKVKRATQIIERELEKLRSNKLSRIQLKQAQDKFIGQIALAEENRMALVISMSKSLVDYGHIDSLEQVFEKIRAVTAEQVLEIANEVLDPKHLSRLVFEPES